MPILQQSCARTGFQLDSGGYLRSCKLVAHLKIMLQEFDTAAEKTLNKLQSDDPAEVRTTILQLLAAHDDIVKNKKKITYDAPCYGPEIAEVMYLFLQTMPPFAYGRILGLYRDYNVHIGIRVNIRNNLIRIVNKWQEDHAQQGQ